MNARDDWQEPTAGDLDRRVQLRAPQDKALADFDLERDNGVAVWLWAKVRPVGFAVYAAGVQTENKVTHRVTIRRRPGVVEGMEVVDGSTVYRVKRSATLGGSRAWLVLEVEELTGHG